MSLLKSLLSAKTLYNTIFHQMIPLNWCWTQIRIKIIMECKKCMCPELELLHRSARLFSPKFPVQSFLFTLLIDSNLKKSNHRMKLWTPTFRKVDLLKLWAHEQMNKETIHHPHEDTVNINQVPMQNYMIFIFTVSLINELIKLY